MRMCVCVGGSVGLCLESQLNVVQKQKGPCDSLLPFLFVCQAFDLYLCGSAHVHISVYIYVHIHVYGMCKDMCAHAQECQEYPWGLSSGTSSIFMKKVSLIDLWFPYQVRLVSQRSPEILLSPPSQGCYYRYMLHTQNFMWVLGLHSGPQACKISPLLSEPFPQRTAPSVMLYCDKDPMAQNPLLCTEFSGVCVFTECSHRHSPLPDLVCLPHEIIKQFLFLLIPVSGTHHSASCHYDFFFLTILDVSGDWGRWYLSLITVSGWSMLQTVLAFCIVRRS